MREKRPSLFFSHRQVSFCRLQIPIEVLHNDFSVDLAGLDHVEADVTIDRGLNAAVTEKLPDGMLTTNKILQIVAASPSNVQ